MPRITFKGRATLAIPTKGDLTGNGSVVQREDGRLFTAISVDNDEPTLSAISISNLTPESFRLDCVDGKELLSETWMTTNTSITVGKDKSPGVVFEGLLTNCRVNPAAGCGKDAPSRYLFFLTNLEFLGSHPVSTTYRGRTTVRLSRLNLELDEYKASLQWAPGYERIITELKAARGINVTAHLHLNAPGTETDEANLELADNICTLLSLASGNHVTWLEVRGYDPRGRWISSRFNSGVTRPFSRHPLIDSNDRAGLRELVERGLPKLKFWDGYLGSETNPRPLRNAIRLALDARKEGIYLQSRTLAAIIVVELLCSHLATKLGTRNLLSARKFRRVQSALRESLREAVTKISGDSSMVGRMSNKLPELNRPAFKEQIERLLAGAELDPGDEEVRFFNQVRNSIVHTGDYEKKLDRSNVEQHWTVLEFVDRIFLGLLGYEGKYVSALNDWKQVELRSPRAE